VTILAACLLSAHYLVKHVFEEPFKGLVEESLLLLGWVANWRTIEVFIYDWLPIVRKRNLYRRLSAAKVDVIESHHAVKTVERNRESREEKIAPSAVK
jgi:hypothetical protein